MTLGTCWPQPRQVAFSVCRVGSQRDLLVNMERLGDRCREDPSRRGVEWMDLIEDLCRIDGETYGRRHRRLACTSFRDLDEVKNKLGSQRFVLDWRDLACCGSECPHK